MACSSTPSSGAWRPSASPGLRHHIWRCKLEVPHELLLLLYHLQVLEFSIVNERHNFVDRFHDNPVIIFYAVYVHDYKIGSQYYPDIVSPNDPFHLTNHID